MRRWTDERSLIQGFTPAQRSLDISAMHALLRERAVAVLSVLGGSAIGPVALLHFPGPREVHSCAC